MREPTVPGSGVDGYFRGTLGYPQGPGRPSAGRYEAELDGEQPAGGKIAGE